MSQYHVDVRLGLTVISGYCGNIIVTNSYVFESIIYIYILNRIGLRSLRYYLGLAYNTIDLR